MRTRRPLGEIPPYAWLAWLTQHDAQMLALSLMGMIENPTCTPEGLRDVVAGWRKNAERAITAENWTASVDGYLEVTVDARLFVFQHGSHAVDVDEEDDDEN